MTHIEGTARPSVPVSRDEVTTSRDEAGSSTAWLRPSRLANWLKATAAVTGMVCGLATIYFAVDKQEEAAAVVGGVAIAAFATLGGITVVINVFRK
ncbi:hypothetical protein ACWGNY_31760 [[Kitasatospora] papulosa]|uniref:hypothetical protein n=1 Tax=[Kitasatospora] papulosa TaxID=1464011 RepID=UPI003645645A